MRKVKWTTTRWRLPGRLRMERFAELLAKKENAEILGSDFLLALERRRETLESRAYKALAIQAPLFLMLTFALLNLDVKVSILGLSTDSAKSLREVLLIISTAFAVGFSSNGRQLQNINEMLKAAARKFAGSNNDLREFLEVRYGLGELSYLSTFHDDLTIGRAQWFIVAIMAFGAALLVGVLFAMAFAVQMLTFREIYLHPNFSTEVSILVIAIALAGDVVTTLMALLTRGIQPYQTMEDFRKLNKLGEKDQEQYNAVIKDIVAKHYSKGLLAQLFGRPKMKKLS